MTSPRPTRHSGAVALSFSAAAQALDEAFTKPLTHGAADAPEVATTGATRTTTPEVKATQKISIEGKANQEAVTPGATDAPETVTPGGADAPETVTPGGADAPEAATTGSASGKAALKAAKSAGKKVCQVTKMPSKLPTGGKKANMVGAIPHSFYGYFTARPAVGRYLAKCTIINKTYGISKHTVS